MNRREFILKTAGAGLIAAVAPELVLAGEEKKEEEKPKYTHVADMYPWDKVARTKEEIDSLPSSSNQVWVIESEKWNETYRREEKLRNLFREPKKMEAVITQLGDTNLNNDELARVYITKFGIEYRILTPDNVFASLQSQSKKDVEKYGTIFFYKTLFKTPEDKSKFILDLIK